MVLSLSQVKIGIIGLGYVGLPLAAYMGRIFPVVGFDINQRRIAELKRGVDRTRELNKKELSDAKKLEYTSDAKTLGGCNFFIVTVPTPIDDAKRPDLTPLIKASETVGRVLKKGDVVVYESTVYPGATEEICIPVVERISGLKYNVDFFAGYSPERVNPADQDHKLPTIKKVTSGSTPEIADLVNQVYAKVITAGTHKASSIRVAEACKVIENVQRDVNIALVNELALLFKRLGIEVREVLEAAETKWNFHYYRPGLVGGHCIGVDPFYLTHKAQQVGFHPEMILAGRRINDNMASYVAQDVIKSMLQKGLRADGARVCVMGVTFKQNCPDIRNTKVIDLINELTAFGHKITAFDPLADALEVEEEYGLKVSNELPQGPFDAIVLTVKHDEIVKLGAVRLRQMLVAGGLLYDVKEVLRIGESDVRL
jgi:UDP-N-acetyl-D-glucosamine/UDP-N-acetyl-D-galactosamine dehydrogenase